MLSVALALALACAGEEPPEDTLPAELPPEPPAAFAHLAQDLPASTEAQAALGRELFFDPLLSVDRSVACASCHQPEHGFADPRPFSRGAHGRSTTRNAPTLLNRGLGRTFMWDGRAATLEEQVLLPIENPVEMDLDLADVLERLEEDAGYAAFFREAFGRAPDREALATALAAFVRRLWSGEGPFDRFRDGDIASLSGPERSGFWLYESRGGCWRCHSGPNFTDESFHNTGVGALHGVPEQGRAAVTGEEADRGRFKTPTLRGLAHTAPYMHDGTLATLRDVVEFYRRGGNANANKSPHLVPLELSDTDVDNLVAFLEALSRR